MSLRLPSRRSKRCRSPPTRKRMPSGTRSAAGHGWSELGEQSTLLARSSPLVPYPLGGTATPVAVNANVPSPGSTKAPLQVISLPARPAFWP
jgi:hypothetical protein